MEPSLRNPYPFPTFENEDDFVGTRDVKKEPSGKSTRSVRKQNPWSRLHRTHTLTSARREYFYSDPEAPNDSLDFILKSEYNHHTETFREKRQTTVQRETLGLFHGRQLKNRVPVVVTEPPYMDHPLVIVEQRRKESMNSIKMAVDGQHSDATKAGYSRKKEGGFFCT